MNLKPKKNKVFVGRERELKAVLSLTKKNKASLLVIKGRRRIGKSRLIQECASDFDQYFEFQGLAPHQGHDVQTQLHYFSEQISEKFMLPKIEFQNWFQALSFLADRIPKKKTLVFLDEISWMAQGSPDFPGILKTVWDTRFSLKSNLLVVLAGSVSSRIDENISKNGDFLGRISLDLVLEELPISSVNSFWGSHRDRVSSFEKFQTLALTGGVPKYLEEALLFPTAEQNILKSCFEKSGFFFNEYERIFDDIFGRRGKTFESVIRSVLDKKLSPNEVAKKLKKSQGSDLTEILTILESSGFLSRDYAFKPDGSVSKLSQVRVKDNFLRYYFKFIEPLRPKLLKGGYRIESLGQIKNYSQALGYQFENLILSNRSRVLELMDLSAAQVQTAAPYFQKAGGTNKGGCQIDLLIQAQRGVFFVCELKCKARIGTDVIREVSEKMRVMSVPKRISLRPVLIYEGDLGAESEDEIRSYFDFVIPFRDFF